MKTGFTPIIFRTNAPENTVYTIDDLKQMAATNGHIKLHLSKVLQNPDGSISLINDVSHLLVEAEVVLNGFATRNACGTVAKFMGWTCGAVTFPGLMTKLTVCDEDGQILPDKENDPIVLSEPAVYVEFIWDEGSQTGELRRYNNSLYNVFPGTMHGVFPIDDPNDDRTPIPNACRPIVDEGDINA